MEAEWVSPCLDYPSPMKTFIASLLALLAVASQRTLDEFFSDRPYQALGSSLVLSLVYFRA
jgi:hypothetical protein